MNGVTDGYMEWMHSDDDDRPDADDMGEWIGEATRAEVERDRNQQPETGDDDRDDSGTWRVSPFRTAGGMW